MKKILLIAVAILAVMLTACREEVERLDKSLTACAPIPEARASATCWTMDGKAYVVGGRDSQSQQRAEMWQYDPAADEWTLLGKMPIGPRVKATACVVGDEVYLGLGFSGRVERDSCYLRDWWRYTPKTGDWTRLSDYPANTTDGAVSFTDGEHIYVCYGSYAHFERDVYVYTIADNRWTKMADNTPRKALYPPRALGCTGATCQGRYYIGTGFHSNSLNFWVEMLPSDDGNIWNERKALPGKGRNSACCAATEQYIYVAGGRYYGGSVTDGYLYDDILRYSPEEDKWVYYGTLPTGVRENMIAFTIDGHVYMGLGNDRDNRPLSDLYRLDE